MGSAGINEGGVRGRGGRGAKRVETSFVRWEKVPVASNREGAGKGVGGGPVTVGRKK